jgi:hypothetical protein
MSSKKPTPSKSKKPSVEFEISDADLDKASGGAAVGTGGPTDKIPQPTRPIRPTGGLSLVCGPSDK